MRHLLATTVAPSTIAVLVAVVAACQLPTASSFTLPTPLVSTSLSTIAAGTRSSSTSITMHAHLGRYTRVNPDAMDASKIAADDNKEQDEQECNIESRACSPLSRRTALGKAAASASAFISVATTAASAAANADPELLSKEEAEIMLREAAEKKTQQKAVVTASVPSSLLTNEPTRIELNVETDYLVRVMEYYDGDMRKVLAAIVRSPYTTVQIDPPTSSNDAARDAILRALYSYEAPEDYAKQASWLNIEEKDTSLAGWLTRKRYRISIPNIQPSEDEPLKTVVSLSNLEAGVGVGIVSYPLTYGYYQYEGYREEQEAKARKEAAAAKRAAAAEKTKKDKAVGPKKEKTVPAAAAKKTAGAVNKAAGTKKAEAPIREKVTAASEQATAKVPTKGPRPNTEAAEAVWRRLQAKVANEVSAEKMTAEPSATASTSTAQPAASNTVMGTAPAAPVPAPVSVLAPGPASTGSPCAPMGNGGMDAYDAYMKKAYAASAAAAAAGTASAASFTPLEPAIAKEEREEEARVVTSSSETPRKSSPFGGYLDTLSP